MVFRTLPILFVLLATLRAQQLPDACPLPDATVGVAYSHQMRATGFTGAPRWLPSGLPEGLSQNADTGLITGTPIRAGNHLVTVFASAFQDSQLAVAICNMTVKTAENANPGVSNLRIVTAALPEAAALTPYSAALEADGGKSPYTWSAVAGSALPSGLSLSAEGRVSGKVAVPGDYAFRVRLADTGGQQFETPLALKVAPPPPFELATKTLAFTAVAGGNEPPPVTVQMTSSVQHPYRASVTTDDGAGWLVVSPEEGEAPGSLTVRANPAGLSAGRYAGRIDVRSRTGDAVNSIEVTLEVADPVEPAKLTLDPGEISIEVNRATPLATRTFRVLNTGGGTLTFRTDVRTALPGWLSITPESGTATASEPAVLTVSVDASAMPRDTDQVTGRIEVTTEEGQIRALGVLLTAVRDEVPVTALPSRVYLPLFTGAPVMPQTLSLRNDGREARDFTVLENLPGFAVVPARGTIASGAVVDLQLVGRDNVTAAPGPVSAGLVINFGAGKEPLGISLGASVNALTAGAPPLLSDNALTLRTAPNTQTALQELRIQNPGTQPMPFQITPASTRDWLNVEPRRGTIEPGAIVRLRVTASSAGLTAGMQRGTLTLQVQGGVTRTIGVLFFPPGACTPTQGVLQMRTLAGNPTLNAAFPIAIEAGLYDNCGNPVRLGTVTLQLSNGDTPVPLTSLLDGRWAGEWVLGNLPADPRIAWSLQARGGGFTAVENGTLLLGSGNLPPAALSLVDPSSGIADRPIAPGGIFRILGARLSSGTAQAAVDSWPSTLSGAEVLLDGRPLPVFQTTADSVTAQAPFDLRINTRVNLSVRYQGVASIPLRADTRIAAPSIRTVEPSGRGSGLFSDGDGNAITAQNPATPGMTVTMFGTGLGKVEEPVEAGTAPGSAVRLQNAVFVRVGGLETRVVSAALTGAQVGLYRVTFVVPKLPAGTTEAAVVMIVGGQLSQTVTLPVSVP
ncbi:MAG: putative Ig domain-containing protein [Bryobacterales bacterium]|nr:putative Ig domain-containing protein [Bryobacterales bacterium]